MYSLPEEDLAYIARQVGALWPTGKTFLITGGTGFFGRWLAESCAFLEEKTNRRNRYFLISRQDQGAILEKIPCLRSPYFELVRHDLERPLPKALSADYVVHAAADVASIKAGRTNFSSMLYATHHIVDAVQEAKPRFLYVSSGGVYRVQDGAAETAETVLAGVNSYGEAKRASEQYVEEHIQNFCVVRCFSFVGPFADPSMAVMQMLEQKVLENRVSVRNPRTIRSYMHARDLAAGLLILLLSGTHHRLYNLGSDKSVSLGNLGAKIGQLASFGQVTFETGTDADALAGAAYVPDTTRIRQEIPGVVSLDLDEALVKTFDFLKKRGCA